MEIKLIILEKKNNTAKPLKPLIVPENYNYIAVFLTLACNLKCNYCINNFKQKAFRPGTISGEEWVRGLNRIISRKDLPLTLQGGEPTLHNDFYFIINNINSETDIDLLTNLEFNIYDFMKNIKPDRIKRVAPYASIRVSYHAPEMDIDKLIDKVLALLDNGYSVGIWGVEHPEYMEQIKIAADKCKEKGIDYRTKEYLGFYEGKLYGQYLYPEAVSGNIIKKVKCRTSELLINPEGNVFRCHSDLYSGRYSIGNILDEDFKIKNDFIDCDFFGHCNPCDIKVKTNRFQQFGHTSVSIKI